MAELGFEAGAAGWFAGMLPLCYATPQQDKMFDNMEEITSSEKFSSLKNKNISKMTFFGQRGAIIDQEVTSNPGSSCNKTIFVEKLSIQFLEFCKFFAASLVGGGSRFQGYKNIFSKNFKVLHIETLD